MTQEEEKALTHFETRLRQLLIEHRALQARVRALTLELEGKNAEADALKARAEEAQRAYETLKTARILEVSGEDIQKARARIAGLIRDVDKCIALLC